MLKKVIIVFLLISVVLFSISSCTQGGTGEDTGTAVTDAPYFGGLSLDDIYPDVENMTLEEIFDYLMEKTTFVNGKIYLFFGSAKTLTLKNLNMLWLEQKAKLDTSRYEAVIDDNILSALVSLDAYGGISNGSEWTATIMVYLRDNQTGEKTEQRDVTFTFCKSLNVENSLSD